MLFSTCKLTLLNCTANPLQISIFGTSHVLFCIVQKMLIAKCNADIFEY